MMTKSASLAIETASVNPALEVQGTPSRQPAAYDVFFEYAENA